ncbi:hydroxypyruvate reductase [Aureimonas altamirensis]|uniref:Hydroxypyruvate reductase n=1 Tax=Aureimonas altamirensis TaxID=370622 RepID=A0A0B1QAQ6_9HYPH|nr:glycerate kinase [Aureimonas altamirensis]KHJ55910.1 hydroxypyruvate reductase [Aureimonas altamirensis]
MSMQTERALTALREIFMAGVASADPLTVLASHLPKPPENGRVVVVGAGKSAATMARAVEIAWPDVPLTGVVVTRYGHAVPTERIEVLEAAHPVPDEASEAAGRRILAAVSGLTADDLVLALISGGGSALMTVPAEGLTLEDKKAVNRLLLDSGAGINEMNMVRRRLSAVKGGRLAAAAHPARLVTLAISDVPGDDPRAIASGPTVPDVGDDAALAALVSRLEDKLPERVVRLLKADRPAAPEGAPDFRLIATPAMALEAAADKARALGLQPLILGDALEGESRELGRVLAGMALSARRHGHPMKAPAVLLSGGETTVTIGSTAPGRGGRNTECLLALALALKGEAGIFAVSGDTDGIDGTEDAAGAVITPDTLARAAAAGFDPASTLAGHDSYSLFAAIGDLVVTGPTLTNVNDLRAILIDG